MGNCLEFAVTITAGCDHPMVAQSDCCACEVCGTRCTGRFGGCSAVWAATSAPRPLAKAENGNGSGNASGAPVELAPLEADLGIDWANDAPAPAVEHDPGLDQGSHGGTSQRRKRRQLGALAAVVLAGVGLGVMLATSGGADSNPRVATVRPPELQFKTVALSDSVDLERNWRLEGATGNRFIGTLTFTNSADTVSPAVYDETLPKSLADNVNVVLFNPYPVVIDPDPVFEYQLQLDPHSSVTVTYEISVPPDGLDHARLDAWAKDVEDELASRVAEAEAALAAATTAEERAAALAFLEAAQAAQRTFKPAPHKPGCTYCGGTAPSGGGGVTSSTDCSTAPDGCPPPLITTTTQPPTTTTQETTTTTQETTTTTQETTTTT